MEKTAKQKQKRMPFWKRGGPEIEHIATHIGKMADNMTLNDVVDLGLTGVFAYLGYKAWGVYGIPTGPLAYKLATTRGGTPPASQIAGLLMLLEMGISIADWTQIEKLFQIAVDKATQSSAGGQITGAEPNPLVYPLGISIP